MLCVDVDVHLIVAVVDKVATSACSYQVVEYATPPDADNAVSIPACEHAKGSSSP